LSACSLHATEEEYFTAFQNFVTKFEKKYDSFDAFTKAYQNFKANVVKSTHFAMNTKSSHRVGITKFFDLTKEEFVAHYLGRKLSAPRKAKAHGHVKASNATAPSSYDWRDKGAVSPVKDQAQCGSCWAFSVVQEIEGQYAIANGKIATFSEQQVVSCDTTDSGCNGGLEEQAYQYIIDAGGLVTEDQYPYTSGDGDSGECQEQSDFAVTVKSYSAVSSDEDEIAAALVANGPLSVALNAESSLMDYTGGVIDLSSDECDPQALDHAVLIVGYGTDDNGADFWIVKNSWNTNWGEDGYFRMARGKGTCGINTDVLTSKISN